MQDSSCENSRPPKQERRFLLSAVASHVLTRPFCLVLWWGTWHYLQALCQYGGLRRNGIFLLLAFGLWFCVAVYGLWFWRSSQRRCKRVLLQHADDGSLRLVGEERPFDENSVKWYAKSGHCLWLFLKNGEVLSLETQGLRREDRDFLELKLSVGGLTGRKAWRRAAGILSLVILLHGSISVVHSAMPYNGKLAWYLKDLQDKRTVKLVHDNVYETGVDGILEDIRRKVDLPENLCLATSFNLHFAPDGTVQTFDTMLYGFDEEGGFVDSYLISYNAAHSRKIEIYLHGAQSGEFEADKDLQPLVEAVRAIPLEQTAASWEDQESYGILYYGVREWPDGKSIRFLNHYGESWQPPFWERDFRGYSISLFCPDDDEIPPKRYVYVGYRTSPGSGILP